MKIKTNDQVHIMRGKDAGKTGKVVQVFPTENKVVVDGMNIMKKHVRARGEGQKGQVLELSAPINVSNVMLICSKCGKPTRVGYKKDGDTKKRFCKQCDQIVD